MRENIGLYRGKRKDNGEWVEGYYVYDESGQTTEKPTAYICHLNTHPCGYSLIPYEVDPETVGQHTGSPDIRGQKIFEGDIMKTAVSGLKQNIGVVEFVDGSFGLRCTGGDAFFLCFVVGSFTVIGNIHDNPELLKEETK